MCGGAPSCWNTTKSRMLSANNWGCRNYSSMSRYDVDVIVASAKKEWTVNSLLGEAQPNIHLWSVTFQFHGDVWLVISPYPAVVAIDEATGMKGSLITEQDVCQQMFIDYYLNWVVVHGHACRIVLRFKMMEYEAQSLPHSGLWDVVSLTCWRFWTLLYSLSYGLHSFLLRLLPPRTFLVTNIPSSLENFDQTSNDISRWSFCTVR